MPCILDVPGLRSEYERLATIPLDPEHHSVRNAAEHAAMVASRLAGLAEEHACTPEETLLLINVAYAHHLTRLVPNGDPGEPAVILRRHGVDDPALMAMLSNQDVHRIWYEAFAWGRGPSDRAWARLAREVDVRLLCLFLVAARSDYPGGWHRDAALSWFLGQARRRGLVGLVNPVGGAALR